MKPSKQLEVPAAQPHSRPALAKNLSILPACMSRGSWAWLGSGKRESQYTVRACSETLGALSHLLSPDLSSYFSRLLISVTVLSLCFYSDSMLWNRKQSDSFSLALARGH